MALASRRFVVVALSVVTVLALTVVLLPSPDDAFREAVAKLRAEGFATTPEELYGPPAPDADRRERGLVWEFRRE
jgi:hypothetical protein